MRTLILIFAIPVLFSCGGDKSEDRDDPVRDSLIRMDLERSIDSMNRNVMDTAYGDVDSLGAAPGVKAKQDHADVEEELLHMIKTP